MEFEDPDGKPYEAFEETFAQIREELLPEIERVIMQQKSL